MIDQREIDAVSILGWESAELSAKFVTVVLQRTQYAELPFLFATCPRAVAERRGSQFSMG